jgi:5-methylcytosine-specific restriction endonuclease McrA
MQFPSLKVDADKIAREAGSSRFCEHAQQELRKKIDKAGKPRLHNQCLVCGAPVGARVSVKGFSIEQIEAMPLFDAESQNSYWCAYRARYEAARQQEINQLEKLWKETYDRYLASPAWKAKSRLVLLRAQGICEGCRLRPATETHHTTYDHVGDEFLFELVALCRPCHDKFHAWILPRFLEELYYAGYGREDSNDEV